LRYSKPTRASRTLAARRHNVAVHVSSQLVLHPLLPLLLPAAPLIRGARTTAGSFRLEHLQVLCERQLVLLWLLPLVQAVTDTCIVKHDHEHVLHLQLHELDSRLPWHTAPVAAGSDTPPAFHFPALAFRARLGMQRLSQCAVDHAIAFVTSADDRHHVELHPLLHEPSSQHLWHWIIACVVARFPSLFLCPATVSSQMLGDIQIPYFLNEAAVPSAAHIRDEADGSHAAGASMLCMPLLLFHELASLVLEVARAPAVAQHSTGSSCPSCCESQALPSWPSSGVLGAASSHSATSVCAESLSLGCCLVLQPHQHWKM